MNVSKPVILLVEDDVDLGNVLTQYLKINGFDVILKRDGQSGLDTFNHQQIDFCILDVMMPEIDGFQLAEKIKEIDQHVPMVFLTAKVMKEDRIHGLTLGADDYICKPFEPDELVLRIQNILKRGARPKTDLANLGIYKFDPENYWLFNNDVKTQLTEKEADVLSYFLHNKGKVIKRADILSEIWGDNDYFNGRSLDVFISRLRTHLKHDKTIQIKSVRGVGFIFNCEVD